MARSSVRARLAAWEAEARNPRSDFADIAPQIVEALQRELTFEQEPPSVPVDTSLDAAAHIKGHTARLRQAILLWLRTQENATEREISTALGLNSSTTRPRLIELQGTAKWAPGLPRLVERLDVKRGGMRCYRAL